MVIARLFHRLNGDGHWHHEPGETVWRRYNFETDAWETKLMTEAEAADSIALWSIK